jgi:polysaccharide export outer membrane protein
MLTALTGIAPVAAESYRLGANDIVKIQVYGEDDLNMESKIGGDGNINFPLLGVVYVKGKTLAELEEYLTARLADGYIRKPKIRVSIIKHRNFYVNGEVKTPGGYPYEDGLTVHKAISLAGGFTEKAEKTTIKITRVREGVAQAMEAELDATVLPDDFVVVAQTKKVYVNGEVKRAGDYPYERGLTVHKAITMAGGLTDKAAAGSIKVLRMINGKEQQIAVQLESGVQPEDIVVVPRSFF